MILAHNLIYCTVAFAGLLAVETWENGFVWALKHQWWKWPLLMGIFTFIDIIINLRS